jgi:predicted nuclease of predicted toxin-antitoxin system
LKLLIDMNLSPSWVEALRAMGFESVTPAAIGHLVQSALAQHGLWLEAGALITIEPARLRARILPLKKRD